MTDDNKFEVGNPELNINDIVLAFDTSTAALAAALVRGQEVLGEIQYLAERNHSVQIVSKLKQLLMDAGIPGDALSGIVVGKGPGSYTGMRIAVSVAKTLAWVWEKPLISVSSLEAIAYGAWHHAFGKAVEYKRGITGEPVDGDPITWTDWVIPLMDARRGQVYTGGYEMHENGDFTCWAQDGVRMMNEWTEVLQQRLSDMSPRNIWIVGEIGKHEEEAARFAAAVQGNAQVQLYPYELDGRWIAWLGLKRLTKGETEHAHTFVPNYTQLAEAEAKLLAASQEV